MSYDNRPIWTAEDEIAFLDKVLLRPDGEKRFRRAAMIILQNCRVWDASVDVPAVRDHVRRRLMELEAAQVEKLVKVHPMVLP